MAEIILKGSLHNFPLYELHGRERLGLAHAFYSNRSPLINTSGGIAERSAQADDHQLIEMVANGERPAALLKDYAVVEEYKRLTKESEEHLLRGNRWSEEAWQRAKDLGLSVVLLQEWPSGRNIKPFVGRDIICTERAMRAFLLPVLSMDYDVVLGRALGYSEEDIRNYCLRTAKDEYSFEPEREVEKAFVRCGPRLDDLYKITKANKAIVSLPPWPGKEEHEERLSKTKPWPHIDLTAQDIDI